MHSLTHVSLLGFVISIIIAIAFSPLFKGALCEHLAYEQVALEESSFYGLSFHTVHKVLCGYNLILDEEDDSDLFHHLGGNGPWIEKVNARFGTYDKDGRISPGCTVDQVHMV